MRLFNTNLKKKSIKSIHEAIEDLHNKKSKARKEVIENLSRLKR
jgi:hypothetical protein